MPYTLIIAEKPAAANKIATALADGKISKENLDGVPFYRVKRKSEEIVVGCSVGHLYTLEQKEKKKWTYPVFDIGWEEMSKVRKSAGFTSKYLKALKSLAKGANKFVLATDLDVEGELIGLNVIRFACKQKDAHRMKFSTLTKPDLIKAYENKSPKIEWGLAKAGEARHFLDWFNGINYSRALTHAIKTTGGFKLMSTGRVQGPSLKIIVDKEKEIQAFKSQPYWEIQMLCNIKNYSVEAWHKEGKIFEKEKAAAIYERIKDEKSGVISGTKKTKITQNPPIPFDLTALQVEAYRCMKITPSATLKVAQELYTSGYISYPRTSSQELPEAIGYEKIISDLSSQDRYSALCKNLLSMKKLKPNNGKKTDPAHPAIYPTGITPEGVEGKSAKLYDLIARRFFSTFGEPAIRQKITLGIDVKSEQFITEGTTTIEKGWHIFYEPYLKLEEIELPAVENGDNVLINEINNLEKETQPPKRYTPASIVKELEKRNLGTKATRSEIIETLYKRAYIKDKSITATELGIKTIEALEKYCPAIIDEEMTRHFEVEMEEIQQDKKDFEEVIKEGKGAVTEILKKFKQHELEIGKDLMVAEKERRITETLIGKCPNCQNGNIVIKKSKSGKFAGCNAYPNCKTLYSLPRSGFKLTEKKCDKCNAPIIIATGNNNQEMCINTNCPTRTQAMNSIQSDRINASCPKCQKGKLILRNSIYGTFLGCSVYPQCKYLEQIPINRKIG